MNYTKYVLLIFVLVMFGCTEVVQTTTPSSVDVNISTPTTTAGVETPPEDGNGGVSRTIEFRTGGPGGEAVDTITIPEGSQVDVTIVVLEGGSEVPSENINIIVANGALAQEVLPRPAGRTVTFAGIAQGTTAATIAASGVQGVLIINVTPPV